MNPHNSSLDLLRLLSAFAVIWLHVSAGVATTHPDPASLAWWTGNLADAFSRWCVPMFILISGRLLLSNPVNADPLPFYRKRAGRVLLPLLFWTLLYLAFRFYDEPGFGWKTALRSVLNGSPYFHLWYLYMIVCLYLFAPFLRTLVAHLDRGALWLLIGICFLLTTGNLLLEGQPVTLWLSFILYLGYFLAGYALPELAGRWRRRRLITVFVAAGLTIAAGVALLLPGIGPRAWDLMYHYLNPLVAVMAFCLFLFVTSSQEPPASATVWIARLAPLSLGIYLFHPLWMRVLDKLAITGFLFHPLFGIPVMTLCAFVLSAATSWFWLKIPWLRRTI